MVGKVMRDSWKDRLSFPFKDTATLLKPLSLPTSPYTTTKPQTQEKKIRKTSLGVSPAIIPRSLSYEGRRSLGVRDFFNLLFLLLMSQKQDSRKTSNGFFNVALMSAEQA